jgi:hypothetical protein
MSRKKVVHTFRENYGPNRSLKTRVQDKSDRKLIDQLASKIVSKIDNSFDSLASLMNEEVKTYYRVSRVPLKKQNVNLNTLRKNIERKLKRTNQNHGNCNLTSEEELRIVGYLRAFDVNGSPLTKPQIISLVRKLHFKKNPGWNGGSWFKSFAKKYQNTVTFKNTKQSGKIRMGEEKFVEMEVTNLRIARY